MRIGVIGLGDIAKKAYLPVIASMQGVTPILCTRNKKALNQLANMYRINEYYENLLDLIESGLDAAMVHSNTASHSEIVNRLLLKGIPTFVDKPLSYSIEETRAIVDVAIRKNTLLFVGFNRRYAPLIANIGTAHIVQLSLEKNRPYLPSDPRTFIYDDFIHVVDTLRFLSPSAAEYLDVWTYQESTQLASIQAHWQSGSTLVTAMMNRVSGTDKESLNVHGNKQSWQIRRLTEGVFCSLKEQKRLGFDDWRSTLYKRGFVDMLDEFVRLAKVGRANTEQLEDILATHELCEQILKKSTNVSSSQQKVPGKKL